MESAFLTGVPRELSQPSEWSEGALPLTFEGWVFYFLLDSGKLHHVSCFLGKEELALPGLEAVPVIFNDWDTVLQGGQGDSVGGEGGVRSSFLLQTLLRPVPSSAQSERGSNKPVLPHSASHHQPLRPLSTPTIPTHRRTEAAKAQGTCPDGQLSHEARIGTLPHCF